MTYPAQAKLNHIQGRVYAGFMVDRKGKIKDIRILSGVNEELDNEAIRVLKLMPDWTPGSAGGSAVDVQYTYFLDFILPKDMKWQYSRGFVKNSLIIAKKSIKTR